VDKQKPHLERGVDDRGNGTYRVRMMVRGQNTSKTYRSREAANAAAIEARAAAYAPAPVVTPSGRIANNWTLKQAFEYALTREPNDGGWKGSKHLKSVRRVMGQLFAYFGEDANMALIRCSRDEDPVGTKTIDGFVEYCRQGGASIKGATAKGRYFKLNSARTLNGKLSALRKLFKLAVERGGVAGMPPFPKARRVGKPKVRYYSPEEEAELLELCASPEKREGCRKKFSRLIIPDDQWLEFRDMLIVLIDTGMRWGECDATRKQHIDRRMKELRVVGISGNGSKNGEERLVGLTDRALEILSKRAGKSKDGRLFTLLYPQCEHMFSRLRSWMGLSKDRHFTLHTARHTFCSRLVQNGVDLLVVKELAGHKSIESTLIYSHLAPNNRRAAIGVLNDFNQSLNKVA
jgi:integrase